MILAVDVGNTNIVVGCISNSTVHFVFRISTDQTKTSDQYAAEIGNRLELNHISPDIILGGIISSVVPPLSNILVCAVETVIKKRPLLLSPRLKTNLDICIDNPKRLGSDLLAGAVAAKTFYSAPLVIIDMGTATTFTVVNKKGQLLGGTIMPGLRISLDALSSKASQLPGISLEAPSKVIGTNTADCMNAGVIFGCAATVDGMIERIECELSDRVTVIMTGGLARYIYPHCKTKVIYDENLLIKGLEIIYNINTHI